MKLHPWPLNVAIAFAPATVLLVSGLIIQPVPAQTTPNLYRQTELTPLPNETSTTRQPSSSVNSLQGTSSSAEVTCGPTTCTCSGINDCDALFTSTLCVHGTESVTEDDQGECKKQR